MSPSSSFWLVRALNCLQNSMMLICAWPRAGPTGGAGVALPAAICSFTEPVTFFAINPFCAALDLFFDLPEFQLDWGRTAEDRNHDLQRLAVLVDLVDHAGKGGKRPFGDSHRLVLLKLHLQLWLVLRLTGTIDDVLHLFLGKRGGLLSSAHESGNPRRRLDHMPDMVVHVHFHQHVAGIEHAFHRILLATTNFRHRFSRNQHAPDFVFETKGADP